MLVVFTLRKRQSGEARRAHGKPGETKRGQETLGQAQTRLEKGQESPGNPSRSQDTSSEFAAL